MRSSSDPYQLPLPLVPDVVVPVTPRRRTVSVTKFALKPNQAAVLAVFATAKEPLTDESLVARYVGPSQSAQGIRSRRNELATLGYLTRAEGDGVTSKGRAAARWMLADGR